MPGRRDRGRPLPAPPHRRRPLRPVRPLPPGLSLARHPHRQPDPAPDGRPGDRPVTRHRLVVEGRPVEVDDGATLIDAAALAGFDIPTLCHRGGLPHHTSCMVCAVLDRRTGRLLPACSFPAADGMDIDISGETVRRARRRVLALLLSEHVGDCEAPCHRTCPARLRIPHMLRAARG
ncbi:MAG: 2Fe-2S iron-sulfur cluster binding domain-containing protein, partial [Lentisphaerae bacterium]|nr:2Fe-2S iron-sulfur cluster binding domain-containing protein [Lentisphaerota bacterium]